MFKSSIVIPNVFHSYCCVENILYALLKDRTVIKYNLFNKKIIWISPQIPNASTIGFVNEKLYCNYGFNSVFIDLENGQTSGANSYKIFKANTKDNFYITISNVDKIRILTFYQESKKRWGREIKLGKFFLVYKNFIFNSQYLNDQVLIAYEKDSFNHCWKIDLSSFADYKDSRHELKKESISHFVGCYKDNLWVRFTSGKLVAFKVNTGQIAHEISNEKSFVGIEQLNSKTQEIIGLQDTYYTSVNLNQVKKNRQFYDIKASMLEHNMMSIHNGFSFPLDRNNIYFCDDRMGKIGVFDTESKAVIWSRELVIDKEGVSLILDMAYKNEKLFVLDRNLGLHVISRIENTI